MASASASPLLANPHEPPTHLSRSNGYRDAKAWELAMTMARVLAEGMPDKLEWLKNQADAMTECGDPSGALQLLKDASERFGEDGKYLMTVGRQYSLLCEGEEAKKYVKRAIKADSSHKA